MTTIVDIEFRRKAKPAGIVLLFTRIVSPPTVILNVLIPKPHQTGILIRRYKRFLADILLEDGRHLTVHCPNSGSMLGCSAPGSKVVISRSANPRRKYAWTLEMVQENGVWIGVNTAMTNRLIREGLEKKIIDDFGEVDSIRPEIKVSQESRLDFMVAAGGKSIFIEVKNCSLAENGVAMFPDAVTARGARHLLELDRLRSAGHDTALIFCIQRKDAERFMPAAAIDPLYAETLYSVYEKGVKVLAYRADVRPDRIALVEKISVFETS